MTEDRLALIISYGTFCIKLSEAYNNIMTLIFDLDLEIALRVAVAANLIS